MLAPLSTRAKCAGAETGSGEVLKSTLMTGSSMEFQGGRLMTGSGVVLQKKMSWPASFRIRFAVIHVLPKSLPMVERSGIWKTARVM